MVTKAELVLISKKEKLPLGTVEKDYILTYVLRKIYDSPLKNLLVFKGGTALHKLYLHERLSIDLDFTALAPFDTERLRKIVEQKELNSIVKDINHTRFSTRVILGYYSVLEFANRIIIDINKWETSVLPLMKKWIESPFFEKFEVLTFKLEELAAEKIRALVQRNKPRDYLDIYYLAQSGDVDFEKVLEIARTKLSAFGDELDVRKLFREWTLVKSLWEQDLRDIVPDMPDFDIVLEKIKNIFINSSKQS